MYKASLACLLACSFADPTGGCMWGGRERDDGGGEGEDLPGRRPATGERRLSPEIGEGEDLDDRGGDRAGREIKRVFSIRAEYQRFFFN